jgi:hypothetical protein
MMKMSQKDTQESAGRQTEEENTAGTICFLIK